MAHDNSNSQNKIDELNERLTELNCLYGISKLIEEEAVFNITLQKITNLLPSACHYPTCVRITVNGNEFKTDGFLESTCSQSSDIHINSDKIGTVEFFYTKEELMIDKGSLQKEKQKLIDAVAERIGKALQRKKALKELRESRELFSKTLKSLDDVVLVLDKDGIFIDCYMTQLPREVFVGRHYKDVFLNEYKEFVSHLFACKIEEVFEEIKIKKQPVNFEHPLTVEGAVRWHSSKVTIRKNCEGNFDGIVIVCRDITENKALEKELKTNRELFSKTLKSLDDLLLVLDKNGIFLDCYMAQFPKEVLIGRHYKDVFLNEYKDILLSSFTGEMEHAIEEVKTKNQVYQFDYSLKLKDGEQKLYFNAKISARKDCQGNFDGVVMVGRNITERKALEKELKENRELLDKTIKAMDEVIIVLDKDGVFIDSYLTQFPKEVLIGRHYKDAALTFYKDIMPLWFADKLEQSIKELKTTDRPQRFDLPMKTGSNVMWLSLKLTARKDCQGNFDGVVMVGRNITERKDLEEKILKENNKLSAILSTMEEGVVFLDTNDVIQEMNDYFSRLIGRERSFYIGTKLSDVLKAVPTPEIFNSNGGQAQRIEILQKISDKIESFHQNPASKTAEFQTPYGSAEVIIRFYPVYHDGKYEGAVISFINITDLIKAQQKAQENLKAQVEKEALEREYLKLSAILSNMEEGVFLLDADNIFMEVNDFFCRFASREKSFYLGKKLEDVLKADVPEPFKKIGEFHRTDIISKSIKIIEHLRQNPGSKSVSFQSPYGNREIIVRIHPIYRNNKYAGAVFNIINVTELMQTQNKLAEAVQEAQKAQKEAELSKEAIEKEHQKLSAILSNMEEGVLFLNADNVIQEANDYLCRLVGSERSSYIGTKFDDITKEIPLPEIFKEKGGQPQRSGIIQKCLGIIEKFRQNPASKSVDFQTLYGTTEVVVRLFPVYHAHTYKGVVISTLNITELVKAQKDKQEAEATRDAIAKRAMRELKSAYNKLSAAKEKAELANRYKSEFLANMSHEIRTPMNAIIGFAELLEGCEVSDDQKEYITHIKNSGEHLLSLINDVLDLSRIEAGRMEIKESVVDIRELVKEVILLLKPKLDEKGLKTKSFIDEDVPVKLIGDAKHIRQILLNLLSNAVKFTRQGRITVTISEDENHPLGPGNFPLVMSVADTGIGIPAERLNVLFQPFVRGSKENTRDYEGTGLGLAITKKLAELLGGKIEVESTAGEGANFHVYLPLKTEQLPVQPKPKTKVKTAEEIDASKKVVLVVEDDEAYQALMEIHLKATGFNVVTAGSGEECLSVLAKMKPDLVILDIILPGMSGWDVLKILKNKADTADIPVMICSSISETAKGLSMGALAYLEKPVEMEEVARQVNQLLKDLSCQKQIAVIEDDFITLTQIQNLFEKNNYLVHPFVNTETALDYFTEGNRADAVILDLMMPEKSIDGLQFLKWFREKDSGKIPVLIYTVKELTNEDYIKINGYINKIVRKGEIAFSDLVGEIIYLIQIQQKQSLEKIEQLETRKILPSFDTASPPEFKQAPQLKTTNHLLLVEDNVVNQKLFQFFLKETGFDLTIVGDGVEAVERTSAEYFDLILMDIQLPKMSGYEATRRIRQNKNYQNVPVIALTAYAMKGDEEKAKEAGCNSYLTKPVTKQTLTDKIKELLQKANEEKDKKEQVPVEEKNTFRNVDPCIIDEIPWYLGELQKVLQKVKQALAEEDFNSIRIEGHGLIGSAGCFGLSELGETGKKIHGSAAVKDKEALHKHFARMEEILKEYGEKFEEQRKSSKN